MPMPLEIGLLSYSGFAACALTTKRMRRALEGNILPSAAHARWIAILLLLAAAAATVRHFGPYQAPVAWVGTVCLGGVAFTLLSSLGSRLAIILAMVSVPAAAIVGLLT